MNTLLELPRTELPSPGTDPSRTAIRPGTTGTSGNPAGSGSRAVRHGTTPGRLSGTARRTARRTGTILTTGLFILAVAVFLMLAIGPRVLGYQTSTMLTGSMSPLINPGDVVVTIPTPVSEIKVGDIITYHIPVEDHRVETHRVTEITTNAGGATAVRTKGDANNGADPWTATLQGETVDRHILTVPNIGQAIRDLRQPLVLNTLMYGAPAILVIGLLASIWGKKPESESALQGSLVPAAVDRG